ncbi:hypothetical protein ACHAXS_013411 [Conticribra weissflogii]
MFKIVTLIVGIASVLRSVAFTPISSTVFQKLNQLGRYKRSRNGRIVTLNSSGSPTEPIDAPNPIIENDPNTSREDIHSIKSQLGAWIPLGSASSLTGLTPSKIRVCGIDLAVWHNPTSKNDREQPKFSAFVDACPHKLAPLSQGRIDPKTKCLQCPYHGWEFDSDGALTNIPQLDEGRTIGGELKKNGAATSLPVHASGDLLFVFVPSEICGESWPIELLPEMHYPYLRDAMDGGKTYFARELPYSADFLIENFMDPAHIPFAHHSLQGTRDDGSPIEMGLVASNFTHVEASFIDICNGKQRDGVLSFQRPAFFHFRTKLNATNTSDANNSFNDNESSSSLENYRPNLQIYVTPIQPGKCRIFIQEFTVPFFPTFLSHAAFNRFLNSDTWLHDTERTARMKGNDNNNNNSKNIDNPMNTLGGPAAVGSARAGKQPFVGLNYLFATKSDMGPSIFRKWWNTHLAAGPPEFFGPAPPNAFKTEAMSRNDQTDPWTHHSRQCVKCRRALRVMKTSKMISVGIAASVAVSTVGRSRPVVGIAAVLVGLGMNRFLEKLCTAIEGNDRKSEASDRSVAAMK